MKPGATLISFIWPAQNKELVERMAARKVTVLAMDAMPRITRAQKMDALSAMANIAGYRAVIEAASCFGRFFPGQVTAAGRVKPAQVLVIGAGVAGLAAIAAARSLGAVVRAFDTRAAVREQVESLGAQFLEFEFDEAGEGQGGYAKEMSEAYLAAEQALIAQHAKQSTSSSRPRSSPASRRRSSSRRARSSAWSTARSSSTWRPSRAATARSRSATRSSRSSASRSSASPTCRAAWRTRRATSTRRSSSTSSRRSAHDDEGRSQLNLEDEVHRGVLVLKDGELMWPPPKPPRAARGRARDAAEAAAEGRARRGAAHEHGEPAACASAWRVVVGLLATAGILGPPEFLQHLTVFLLACVVGWHVVWNVTPALHTPLMSVTNAISGIILIGGMVVLARARREPARARPRRRRRARRVDQRRGRLPRHAAHAEDVPEVGRRA